MLFFYMKTTHLMHVMSLPIFGFRDILVYKWARVDCESPFPMIIARKWILMIIRNLASFWSYYITSSIKRIISNKWCLWSFSSLLPILQEVLFCHYFLQLILDPQSFPYFTKTTGISYFKIKQQQKGSTFFFFLFLKLFNRSNNRYSVFYVSIHKIIKIAPWYFLYMQQPKFSFVDRTPFDLLEYLISVNYFINGIPDIKVLYHF